MQLSQFGRACRMPARDDARTSLPAKGQATHICRALPQQMGIYRDGGVIRFTDFDQRAQLPGDRLRSLHGVAWPVDSVAADPSQS